VGDAGLEKKQKSAGKTRAGTGGGAQSGAVGADLGTLAAGDRDRIVEGFAYLPGGLKGVIIDAAWEALSDSMKRNILAVAPGTPKSSPDD
jgi:hypothetical protein